MRQMLLRLSALDSLFENANAHTTENKSEVRHVELKDSQVLEELYIGVTRDKFNNILKYKMFDNSFSDEILRSDETSSAELPTNFDSQDIEAIKNQYKLTKEAR